MYADDPLSPISIELNIHEKPGLAHGPRKTPIQIPEVWQDGHLIILEAGHANYVLNLVDEYDDVVYTAFIPAGTSSVILPTTLSGDFEIRFETDTYYYYGMIIRI